MSANHCKTNKQTKQKTKQNKQTNKQEKNRLYSGTDTDLYFSQLVQLLEGSLFRKYTYFCFNDIYDFVEIKSAQLSNFTISFLISFSNIDLRALYICS